jgi:cytochrome c-type biogenesis protein CcmH/NrfG
MGPLGKRILVLLFGWVLLVMVIIQVYDNVSGKNSPISRVVAAPTAMPTVEAAPDVNKLADLQTCVANDPSNLQCTGDLADLYYSMGQYPQAQVNYERALQLSPHDSGLMLRLAGTYIYQQDFDKAVETLQKAVVLQPDSPEIHLLLGLSLSQLTPPRVQDAIAEWRSVVTLAPDSTWAAQAAKYISDAQQ